MGKIKILARMHRLSGLNFDDTAIFDSDFSDGILHDCHLGVEARLENSVFIGTFIGGGSLRCMVTNCIFDWSTFDTVCANNATFYGCVFKGAKFIKCSMRGISFLNCSFLNCTFESCDFSYANMRDTGFTATRFLDCDFYSANLPETFAPRSLEYCKNVPYIPMVCPEEGEFIGYKKAWINYHGFRYYVIVTLCIPADARRSSGTGRKCRCDKAIVEKMEWVSAGPSINPSIAHSIHNHDFHYVAGRVVQPTNGFCEDRWKTCAGGIHFFMNKQEAIDY